MKYMATCSDKQFDLAIVDPPYGLGNTNRFSRGKKASIHDKFNWNNSIPNGLYFSELERISIHQIIWGCNYFYPYIKVPGRIIHYKNLTDWSKGKNLSECDLASQTFNNKIEYFDYQWSGNVQNGHINWNNNGNDSRIHPQQKPIALYKWLLRNYAKEGDKIIDTHLGSGSSAIAAFDGGFDFVGCEIDKDYFGAAKKRFEIYKMQLKIF
jgi:site-specific DNA-methyltransferase (adenine-specific)